MRNLSACLALLPALVACSGDDDTAATPTGTDAAAITFDVATTIEPGDEVELCKFVRVPDDRGELGVNATEHVYTAGSHHFLLYRTNVTEMPAGGDELVACDEQGWMNRVAGVVYGAQQPEDANVLPAGVGQRFAPGEILLMQVHYLNTTPTPIEAKVHLTMHTIDPALIESEVGVLFFFNPVIHVPALASASAELACPVPTDMHLLYGASHMHRRAVAFEAHLDGEAAGSLFATDDWSEPVPRIFDEGEGLIEAGSTITYGCDFDNPDDVSIIAGPSAEKNEMCMFVGMYYPKADPATENCWNGAAKTSGTTSCLDTIGCSGACTPGDDACIGACLEASCPNAAMPLMRMLRCVQPACGATCEAAGSDSEACTACVTDACLPEAIACQSATCAAP